MVWAGRDDMESLYGDPVAVWRSWVSDADALAGVRLESGHHLAEEVPDELARVIRAFLNAR